MSESDPERIRLMKAILRKASLDREFRRRLLYEPKEAIESAFHVKVVNGFKIKFIEKDPGLGALIVLPDMEPEHEASETGLSSDGKRHSARAAGSASDSSGHKHLFGASGG